MANRKNTQAVLGPLVKSLIFAMVGTMIFAMLFIEIGDIRFNDTRSYKAIFASSSQLKPAENVTASGVKVGTVKGVEVYDNDKAKVEFTVDSDRPLTEGTQVFIRFSDLTGGHYLEVRPGPGGMAELKDGATIPISQTQPALDLDVLLAGFNPLFEGLGRQNPEQINELAANVIGVFEGQSGAIGSLLTQTASLAGSLAERDQLIGDMIDSLNQTLSSLDARSEKLSATFLKAQEVISNLSKDRTALLDGFVSVAGIVRETADLGVAVDEGLDVGLPALYSFAKQVNAQGKEFDRILSLLPGAYLRLGRASTSIAGYSLGLCSVTLRLTGPDGKPFYTPQVGPNDNDPRCTIGADPLAGPIENQLAPYTDIPFGEYRAGDPARFGG